MLIDSVTLRDFGRYAEADVHLDGIPVAVLMGPNRAGKSTVADAVRWALRNAARGVGGSTNADLVRRGATACKVTLTARATRGGPAVSLSRTKSGADSSQETVFKALGIRDAAALDAALDAGRFMAMSPKERKALAFKASGAVLDEATLRAAGVDDGEVLAAALAKGPEAAERLATEKKRTEARAADAVRVPAPTDVSLTTPRGLVPVSQLDAATMAGVVTALRAQRDQVQRSLAAAERGVSDAAQRAQRVAAAEQAVAVAEADLASARNAAEKAARARPTSASLRDEAEQLVPAATEAAPPAPAPLSLLPGPSTADGEAARAAVQRAEAAREAAQNRVLAAEGAVARAREALAAAKAHPWTDVAAVAGRLRDVVARGVPNDVADDLEGEAAALDALVTRNAPSSGAAETDLVRAEGVLAAAVRELRAAEADLAGGRTRFDQVAAAYRTEAARVNAENDTRRRAHEGAADLHRQRLAAHGSRVRVAAERRRAILADAARVEHLEASEARAVRDAEGSLRAAQAHLEGVRAESPAATGDPVALRADVDRLDGEIAAASRASDQVTGYHQARGVYEAARLKADALDAAAGRYERMEKALRPDGVLGRLAAGPLGAIRAALGTLAPDVVLTDEWQVLIRNAPAGLASRSEQWRAGVALTVALASVSGVRFAIIDDADVLVDERERSGFLKALADLRESFDQVLVLAAVAPDRAATLRAPGGPLADVIGLWRVVDGSVARVEPAQPTAAPAAA